VIMQPGKSLTPAIINDINLQIRHHCSPRHVPDEIFEVPDIPYTISGKKMEAPVKKILMGKPITKAANLGAMRNPESLHYFATFAGEMLRKQN